ncbi:DUF3667 domain-containing protein [Phenylobacterium sp.]|uniref:DUF3667 domain-containing protein n=1 Tax=Phenylobacterium sp. TaxID=1871053 RepID=UPI003003047A
MTAAEQPGGACAACGTTLSGRYCHACGQDTEARPRALRDMVHEAFSEASLIDGQGVRTLVALVTRPSRILIAYREGAGSLYASPVKIFVVVTALFLAVLNFSDVVIYQHVRQAAPGVPVTATADPDGVTVHLTGATEEEHWMQRRVEPPIDPRIHEAIRAAAARAASEQDRQNLLYEIQSDREQAVISERLGAWLPNAVWLLTPLFALLLAPLFGRRRLFMEHLVFALWAHVTAFTLLMLLALANWFGANIPAWPLAIPYLVYFTRAASRYYGLSMGSAAWRAVVHTAAYLVLVLMPAAIIVAISALDLQALLVFLAA